MKEVFAKTYDKRIGILFYFHIQNNILERQIEIRGDGKYFFDRNNHISGKELINDIFLNDYEIISKSEFELIWNNK